MNKTKHYYFCLTQGRTGTHFLTALLANNLPGNNEAHHEILGFDKFGVDTPNVSTFMIFNTKGNIGEVKRFWKQKLTRIANRPTTHYAETSHLLAKAGLIENLHLLPKTDKVHLIILKRDTMKVIQSYHNNYDFIGIGNIWMWFLDPDYPKKIVDPLPFSRLGVFGIRLWYIYEIDARIEYYKIKLKDRKNIQITKVDIEDLNDPAKVSSFLKTLGTKRPKSEVAIPPKLNVSRQKLKIHEHNIKEVKRFIASYNFNPKQLAKQYVQTGGNWD